MQDGSGSKGWDPKSTACFWINRTSRTLLKLQDGRLRPLGFGMSQMPVLQALGDGKALSQKELARGAGVEQPTMAELLSRMERDGVVERQPDPEDGRATLTSLTRRSRVRLPKARAALMELEDEATAGLSAAEKVLLVNLLQRVLANLEK
jgi:DNA-binding MarR family transcriptional regulator